MRAAQKGHTTVVKTLLKDRRVDARLKDIDGLTAHETALREEYTEVAALLQASAKPALQRKLGWLIKSIVTMLRPKTRRDKKTKSRKGIDKKRNPGLK